KTRRGGVVMCPPFSLEREKHHDEYGYSRRVTVGDEHLREVRPTPQRNNTCSRHQRHAREAFDRRVGPEGGKSQEPSPHQEKHSKAPESESPAEAFRARARAR